MKRIITIMVLFTGITCKAQSITDFPNVTALAGWDIASYEPTAQIPGAVVTVSPSNNRGLKSLWYTIISDNTEDFDNYNYIPVFGFNSSFAWRLYDSTQQTSYTPTGTSTQYLAGNGSALNVSNLFVSWGLSMAGNDIKMTATPASGSAQESNTLTLPIKKTETFAGTTGSNGEYTVTFSNSYSTAPNIQASIVGGTDPQIIRVTSVSTTSATVLVRTRTDIVGLLPTWSNVNGASVQVLVTEQ